MSKPVMGLGIVMTFKSSTRGRHCHSYRASLLQRAIGCQSFWSIVPSPGVLLLSGVGARPRLNRV